MNRTPQQPNRLPLLVDARQAAALLGISQRKLAQLVAWDDIPSRKIGRLRRFSVMELKAWVDAGCPVSSEELDEDEFGQGGER